MASTSLSTATPKYVSVSVTVTSAVLAGGVPAFAATLAMVISTSMPVVPGVFAVAENAGLL